MVQGFKALNTLVACSDLVVLPFDHDIRQVFGPFKAPFGSPLVHDICMNHLKPKGSTNIELALSEAYARAEDVVEGAVTILLMTDGEDNDMKRKVERMAGGGLLDKMRGQPSGVFLCVVGICEDADAILLGKLAEIGNGTYTITQSNDIAGLIGSLVALVGERVHEKVVLNVFAEDDEGKRVLDVIVDKPVLLKRGELAVRIPFSVTVPDALGKLHLKAQTKVWSVGSVTSDAMYESFPPLVLEF